MSKSEAVGAMGGVVISQLDAQGTAAESWELVNPWIKDVKFGELDYESDDMVDIEVELRYDYAILNGSTKGAYPKSAITSA